MTDVEQLLPLKPAWFHILLALGNAPLHGFAIRDAVLERTGGKVTLWPATLYGSMADMAEEGLIEPLAADAEPDDDARRRYYRLTPRGRRVLKAEADRMAELATAAQAMAAREGAAR